MALWPQARAGRGPEAPRQNKNSRTGIADERKKKRETRRETGKGTTGGVQSVPCTVYTVEGRMPREYTVNSSVA